MLGIDWGGVNEWLSTFFKMSVGSVVIIVLKSSYTYIKKIYTKTRLEDERRDTSLSLLKEAIMAQHHDTLYRLTGEYLKRGSISLSELDNLEYIYKSYKALGGNGSGEYRFNKCKELPLREGSDPELEKLIKDHKGGDNDE